MTKHTFLLLLLLHLLLPLCAQEEGFYLGGHAGVGSYWNYDRTLWNTDPGLIYAERAGLFEGNAVITGVSAEYRFNPWLGAGVELSFSHQSQNYPRKSRAIDPSETISTYVNYLSLPLLLHFHSANSYRPLGLYFSAGVSVSALTNYKIERAYLDPGNVSSAFVAQGKSIYVENRCLQPDLYPISCNGDSVAFWSNDIDRWFSGFQLGLQAELGLELFAADHWNIRLGMRGTYDLNNIYNTDAGVYEAGTDTELGKLWTSFPKVEATKGHNMRLVYLLSATRRIGR